MSMVASLNSELEVDDLADVCLDGVALVSDDPSTWVVPTSMCDHDSVYGWWKHLHHHELLWSAERINLMHTLLDSCSSLRGLSAGTHNKVRTATERLIGSGMTLAELQRITGMGPATLLGGPGWKAWQMLQAGCTVEQVVAATTEAPNTVARFAKMISGAPVVRVYPKWMRAEAFKLLDSGLSLSATAAALSERHGYDINKHNVHSWVRRNKQVKVNNVSAI